jgi:phosphoribosylglycinamide formyltransferase-1
VSAARVAIFISGRGSNMLALIDAMAQPGFPATPALVLSDTGDAAGLAAAEARGVPTAVVDRKAYPDKESFEIEIHARLRSAQADLVCLAGFMRVLSPWLVEKWAGKILNIHPSLLPSFPGLDTHKRALEAGVKLAGCTVHVVTTKLDDGPVLGQAAVPVLPGDDEAALAARVLAAEHTLYAACVKAFVTKESRAPSPDARLVNPATD